ncbi:TPA: geranylgeranyl reductase family protein [Candidatus Bathyarchaeota archaeon]|nr:geranylgeranyl reductase family protein [Candidatus Bathyarchaeota archaeon]
MEKYDVIVTGAGTAGCMAAKVLASRGFNVCLIDRKDRRSIGYKVCGDAVGKHHFDNIGLPYPSGEEKEGDIVGVKIYSPDRDSVFRISGYGLTGFMINRYLFGQRLLKYAVDAGAVLKDEVHVSIPLIKNGYVKGVLATDLKTGEKLKLLSEITIDASGVSAVIRRNLPSEMGLETELNREDTVICYREIRQLSREIEEPNFCEIYLDLTAAPGGYYWIFPKKDGRVNVGLGVASSPNHPNPKSQFHRYVLNRPLFDSSSMIHGGGGIVPTRRPLDSLVGNGVVLIGDAGCQVNPVHGGGIGPSMMGGMISGEVIADALESGDPSPKTLWPINLRFMETYGIKQAGLDIFRIFLQGLTNEDLNYGMKYQIITEEDLLKASLGEDVHINIGEATRRIFAGLGRLSFLKSLYIMAKTLREARNMYKKYPTSPDKFLEWKKKIMEIFDETKDFFWR